MTTVELMIYCILYLYMIYSLYITNRLRNTSVLYTLYQLVVVEQFCANKILMCVVSLQRGWTPLTIAVLQDYASVAKYLVNVSNADCSKVPQVTFVKIVLETIIPCKFITLMDLQELNINSMFLN